ncbi:MAG: tetratricopeptide repeat protein [Myxococcota bacterium]
MSLSNEPTAGGSSLMPSEDPTLAGDGQTPSANRSAGPGLPVPGQFGRFEIRGRLGRGGMGEVLEAFDPNLDRPIALKVLHPGTSKRHGRRLVREAKALAKLSHPNVVQVYEVGEIDDQTFVAMELVRGQTLQQWQAERPPWQRCVELYLQAGRGLAAAHAVGLIHRDFKPSNCIVDDAGKVRVLDFGLARKQVLTEDERLEEEHERSLPDEQQIPSSLTVTGAVLGTVAYMSLQQLSGDPVDDKADQFSFCVSLYEAVHGQRPFEDQSVGKLTLALMSNQVRPIPSDIRIPPRLRRLLLRGLHPEPQSRWPSVQALLDELEDLIRPRRTMTMAVLLGGGLALAAGGLWWQSRDQDHCQTEAELRDEIWTAATAQSVNDALLATELPYAADTWSRIEPRLQGYAEGWAQRRRDNCRATRVHGDQSEQVMDLRGACLSTRALELREATEILANADAAVAEQAVAIVTALPSLERCDDVEALRQQVPPPEDPEQAKRVREHRERLPRIRALIDAGRYDDAATEAEALVELAVTEGHPPLQAEAWQLRGAVYRRQGRFEDAEKDLVAAYALAVEHGHERVAALSSQMLVNLVGGAQVRHAEGQQWGVTALALAHRRSPAEVAATLDGLGNVLHQKGELEPSLEQHREALDIRKRVLDADHPAIGTSLDSMGRILLALGRHEDALESHLQALEIHERAYGPSHPHVSPTLSNLGQVMDAKGDLDAASEYHGRALSIREQALGPDHPDVAGSVMSLGLALRKQGKLERSRTFHQRALDIWLKVGGAEHPNVAVARINLGAVLDRLGHQEEALDEYGKAKVIIERAFGSEHPNLAAVLDNMGVVLHAQGKLDEAYQHHLEAKEIRSKSLGPDHPQVAMSLGNVSRLLIDRKEFDAAREQLERALAIFEKVYGTEHPQVATTLIHLARTELRRGDGQACIPFAERSLEIRASLGTNPVSEAFARFVLGRCHWAAGDRSRGRSMVEAANAVYDEYAKTNGTPAHEHEAIRDWLREHAAPAR